LLIEWPEGGAAPTKYWLSTLPHTTPIATLVDTAKLRWRIERDFQDLKRSVSITTRVEDGADSTIMRRSRSQPTASWSPNGVRFPPQPRSGACSKPTSRPGAKPSRRVVAPLRPERHAPFSISTLRRKITVALAKRLPRCPCCLRKRETSARLRL
jgi:hypothetical protein